MGPIAASTLLFPEDGMFPFRWSSLVFVLGACGLALVITPAQHRALRAGTVLYAIASAAAFLIATPLGGNLERLGMYLAAPLLVALVPRRRVLLLAMSLPLLLWWQWAPAIDGMFRPALIRRRTPPTTSH
jgi:hypothetical protein